MTTHHHLPPPTPLDDYARAHLREAAEREAVGYLVAVAILRHQHWQRVFRALGVRSSRRGFRAMRQAVDQPELPVRAEEDWT